MRSSERSNGSCKLISFYVEALLLSFIVTIAVIMRQAPMTPFFLILLIIFSGRVGGGAMGFIRQLKQKKACQSKMRPLPWHQLVIKTFFSR